MADGVVQTGVTALLPHQGDIFHEKVLAASYVINGFGKTTGLVQIDELGTLETPILFTNTLSVGTAQTALVKYMLEKNPDICETTGSVNPVVCECNDCGLNDIRGLHVTEQHVFAALADCKADFAEGAVGAGRGMRCHGLKGGIGSASRVVELDGKPYTMGALVLSNHALFDDLIVAGTPIHTLLNNSIPPHEDKGSIITVLATDIPLSERQLRRLCRRALVGLSRTGSYCGNGSGEIVIAFTTANRVPMTLKRPSSLADAPRRRHQPALPRGGRVRGGKRPEQSASRRDRDRLPWPHGAVPDGAAEPVKNREALKMLPGFSLNPVKNYDILNLLLLQQGTAHTAGGWPTLPERG